ncbi:hypothetical protein GTQ99_22195, partial [Kineococcus sp. T13]|uniref:hypothetical protein n=1 Tax=Kineococcus vitellinus TaxID=2696565 RepID=UPI00196A5481
TQQAMQRFRDLAVAAGFPATADSPALLFLRAKFGVGAVRQVDGGVLESLLTWFEGQRQPGEAFRSYVQSTLVAARRGAGQEHGREHGRQGGDQRAEAVQDAPAAPGGGTQPGQPAQPGQPGGGAAAPAPADAA